MATTPKPIITYKPGTQPTSEQGMKEYLNRELQKIANALLSLKDGVERVETEVNTQHP